jgi:hypothetical protein
MLRNNCIFILLLTALMGVSNTYAQSEFLLFKLAQSVYSTRDIESISKSIPNLTCMGLLNKDNHFYMLFQTQGLAVSRPSQLSQELRKKDIIEKQFHEDLIKIAKVMKIFSYYNSIKKRESLSQIKLIKKKYNDGKCAKKTSNKEVIFELYRVNEFLQKKFFTNQFAIKSKASRKETPKDALSNLLNTINKQINHEYYWEE